MEYIFPKLETKRLLLRALHINDTDDLFNIRYNDEVIKFIARKKTNDKESVKQFIIDRNEDCKKGRIVFWGIQKKNKTKLIGTISLWNFNEIKTVAEVGYALHPDFHNKGFMSETLEIVLRYGFSELNLKAIEAFTDKNNVNSQLLLEKFNFKCDVNRIDKGFPNNRIYIKTND